MKINPEFKALIPPLTKERWNKDGQSALNGYDLRIITKSPCCVVANLNYEAAKGA